MRKTYKFKATANEITSQNAEQWLQRCQQLYNAALEQRIVAYKRCGVTLSAYSQSNELPELKAEYPEFKQVGSQVLQDVVERVGKAFKGFFSRLKKIGIKAGFPRFRSRARYDSFTLKQAGWKLDGRHLKIKGVGTFKLFLSREIEGRIKTVTVRRDACGDWWVCFSCDEVPSRVYPEPQSEVVGIDVGLNAFCTDTEGVQIANPKYYRQAQADLRRRQRKVARRKKGSQRRKKAVKELVRAHRRVKNLRLDFLHKTANHYIQKFKTICVEKLNIRNMVKNRHLSKSISDAGWGTFVELLLCKAAEPQALARLRALRLRTAALAGREVIQVDPKGTSQNCSGCGEVVKKSLAVRRHCCPHCGLELDRDENAARNIAVRGAGLALQALT